MDVVLIPGFWLDASSWDRVIPVLEDAGHRPHGVTLPGMAPDETDRSAVTLQDQIDFVTGLIDSLTSDATKVLLVGHSGGGAVAHAAVDLRPDRVARVVYVDCLPSPDGGMINDSLPVVDGVIPLPDWSFFGEEDLVDLDDHLRAELRDRSIPTPVRVASDPKRLTDARRHGVPATVIACEFTCADMRRWMREDDPGYAFLKELAATREVECVDLPTGHWPQFTRPGDLGRAIVEAVGGV